MNLNEITVSALTQLGRSSDAANISECRIRFSLYANQAQQELADAIGITQANLSILKTNKGKAVRFSTLDAICKKLDCTVGDILEYVEDK